MYVNGKDVEPFGPPGGGRGANGGYHCSPEPRGNRGFRAEHTTGALEAERGHPCPCVQGVNRETWAYHITGAFAEPHGEAKSVQGGNRGRWATTTQKPVEALASKEEKNRDGSPVARPNFSVDTSDSEQMQDSALAHPVARPSLSVNATLLEQMQDSAPVRPGCSSEIER